MALYEKSDGILETHVQWEDIEEEMRKEFGENAKFGENKKATCISDMKGFMSRIALIDPDWVDPQPGLPKKFAVKISSQLAFLAMIQLFKAKEDMYSEDKIKQMEEMTKEFHNREVGAYELLMNQKNTNIPFTKIYGMRKFDEGNQSKGFIISEYIPDVHSLTLYESIPVDDLIPVIKALAQFAALGEKVPEEKVNFARGSDLIDIAFSEIINDDWMEGARQALKAYFSDDYKELVEDLIRLMDKSYINSDSLQKYKEIVNSNKTVLTHSDIWNANLLFTKSENELKLEAIIDFQTCSITNAALDLVRCFTSCLSTEDRRERGDELINIYYETFVEALDGRPAPYELKELKNNYNIFFPLLVFLILPGIASSVKMTEHTDGLKETTNANILDKMIGLLEDIIAIHYFNCRNFPNFFNFE